jgi:hypothetical protein
MSFYLRKALKVGPMRFNLSKSGVGVSAGVKGFRLGTGPRGNYVHMGRGGVYYRSTLSAAKGSRKHPDESPGSRKREDVPDPLNPSHEPLQEIESGSVVEMVDSSSASLLEEINTKRKKVRLWPIVGATSLFCLLLSATMAPSSFPAILVFIAGVGATTWAYIRDQLSKSVVLFYTLEGSVEKAYQRLHGAFEMLLQSSRIWHIEAEGKVTDWKRQAGADSVVSRKAISPHRRSAPYIKTNISVPAIPVGRQTMFFFPDRILVFDKDAVGAVGYKSIDIDVSQTRFIESEGVPRDAKVVDHTWKYVNKKGGPDKRFKDNTKLPIALYEDIHFTSASGVNELVELSRLGLASKFKEAIAELAGASS